MQKKSNKIELVIKFILKPYTSISGGVFICLKPQE